MAAKTGTYTLISSQIAAGSTITFSSIPSTYTDLVLVIDGITYGADSIGLRFNSDTASNYSYTTIYGNGTAAGSTRGTNETYSRLGAFYSTRSTIIANILDYSNATTYKTTISRASNAANQVSSYVSSWRSTSAITNITVNAISGGFDTTAFKLYGIEAGNL